MKFAVPASLVLFVIACWLPALSWRDGTIMTGLHALAVGWSGIFAGVVPWYANLLWVLSMLAMFLRRPLGVSIGFMAVGLALSTLFYIGHEVPGDEGGVTKTAITHVLPGCYCWIASVAIPPFAALAQKLLL